jgi:NAD(P)-dependent dehydrogenase (short-subunit alcohol dehydrogenase family)
MGTPYQLSPDGIEVQACNATGHFALTSHLLPILKRTASSVPDSHVRIVNVASMAHLFVSEPKLSSLEGINRQGDWPMSRYSYSKLNVCR